MSARAGHGRRAAPAAASASRKALGGRGRRARRHGSDSGHAQRRVPARAPRCAARRLAISKRAGAAAAAVAAAAPSPRRRRRRQRELSWDDVQPGGSDRPRSRLPPGAAGRQAPERRSARPHPRRAPQAVAGARLPGAGGAHPRQPRPRAQRLSHQPGRRAGRRERHLSRHASSPSIRAACSASCRASRPAIRPSAWRRSGSSRRAAIRRRPSATPWSMPSTVIATHLSSVIQSHAHETARPRGSAAAAQRPGQERAAAGRGPGAAACCRWRGGARAAGPAGRARADPQHARHHRDPGRARAALPGPGGAAGAGAHRARAARSCRTSSASARELPVITLEPDLEQLLQARCRARLARATRRSNPAWRSGCNSASGGGAQRQEASGEAAGADGGAAAAHHAGALHCARACRTCTCWPGMRFPTTARSASWPRSAGKHEDRKTYGTRHAPGPARHPRAVGRGRRDPVVAPSGQGSRSHGSGGFRRRQDGQGSADGRRWPPPPPAPGPQPARPRPRRPRSPRPWRAAAAALSRASRASARAAV